MVLGKPIQLHLSTDSCLESPKRGVLLEVPSGVPFWIFHCNRVVGMRRDLKTSQTHLLNTRKNVSMAELPALPAVQLVFCSISCRPGALVPDASGPHADSAHLPSTCLVFTCAQCFRAYQFAVRCEWFRSMRFLLSALHGHEGAQQVCAWEAPSEMN